MKLHLLLGFFRRTSSTNSSCSTEAQEYLVKAIDELKKTTMSLAEKVDKISKHISELSKEVGKLSDAYGFILEDVARSFLPSWLSDKLDVEVAGISRAFFNLEDKVVELDFYGVGKFRSTGEPVVVVGEAKSRIHRDDVLDFCSKVEKLIASNNQNQRVIKVMYGLFVHPTAVAEARKCDVTILSPYTAIQEA